MTSYKHTIRHATSLERNVNPVVRYVCECKETFADVTQTSNHIKKYARACTEQAEFTVQGESFDPQSENNEDEYFARLCSHHMPMAITVGQHTVYRLSPNASLPCEWAGPVHMFTFEIWADALTSNSQYQDGRTPHIEAATPIEARKAAVESIASNQHIGAGNHLRAHCRPPHPGIDPVA